MPTRALLKKPAPERLEARISLEKKRILKHAAALTGQSLTDFIISAVEEAATRVIQQQHQIDLSLKDHEFLIEALSNPPEPSPRLLKAMRRYKSLCRQWLEPKQNGCK